jgi:hypothetical protein
MKRLPKRGLQAGNLRCLPEKQEPKAVSGGIFQKGKSGNGL